MPRPTAAQLAYGSSTVLLSTLAMLLLSQTSSTVVIAIIAVAALALGLLVALTLPTPKRTVAVPAATPRRAVIRQRVTASATTNEPVREPSAP
ncbi:hypothetical protein [Streptomyces sp. NPDC006997]|uniref:hypothetical protein n=1 Tax=Streptomyces sp. NPDC006997 TaxID=3155356 RepID=UPI003402049F